MKIVPALFVIALALVLAACAARRDDSRYVALGAKRGYYVIEPGSPLQEGLGYGLAPVADTASPLRRGHGTDVIAFRFNRAGVLAAPPAYLAQLGPESFITTRLAGMRQGVTTWSQIRAVFPPNNRVLRQSGGAFLVYHEIPVYNPLEDRSDRDR